MKTKLHERTLIILKPDAIQRGLIGEIITRFERKGLKIVAAKFTFPTLKQAQAHYDMSEADKLRLGNLTIQNYKDKGIEDKRKPLEIAVDIQKRLERYITTGPVLVLVIEGAHAIEHVRKIRGSTNSLTADIGSITADLVIDSYFLSDPDERAIRNLVHASGSVDEAEREIKVWFDTDEILEYDLAIEKILYDKEWDGQRSQLTKSEK